jgi:hypothetical protein
MWHTGERGEMCTDLVGKLKGKIPLVRPRHRWEDGIKMDLKDGGGEGGVDSPGSG